MTDADFELFEKLYKEMEEQKKPSIRRVETKIIPYGHSKCCEVPYVEEDGFAVCPECGLVNETFSFQYKPEFVDSVKGRPSIKRAYNRVDTFLIHLDKLTGGYTLKSEEREALKEFKKRMIGKAIDYFTIKAELKLLKLQKYYGVIPCIMRDLFSIKVLDLSSGDQNSLTAKFREFDDKFSLQDERKNSINYFWLTRKFCEELGFDIAKWGLCPDLKDPKKKREMLKIYNSIMAL